MNSTQILQAWAAAQAAPEGAQAFSRQIGALIPYSGGIGARVLELRPGYARLLLEDRPELRNHLDSIHAVALANLAELTAGLAAFAALPSQGRGILRELHLRYEKKARGRLTAEAQAAVPSTPGEHEFFVDASLRDAAGDLVAAGRALWRVEIPA